jgi:DNA polymerase-3 subunit alpha
MSKTGAKLEPSDYVHLHNHTQYSLLDGLTKVPPLIEFVKECGMHSVAITDHGTLSGAIEFYKTAKAADIKPIIGMEAYVAPRGRADRDPTHDRQYFHLTMLAMDNQGYQNLMQLSTLANLEGFYYRPRIDHELLEKYNDGIIVLSGCIGSEIGEALRQDQYDQAKKIAQWHKKIFGNRYYIEVQDHGHPDHPTTWDEQDKVNQQSLKLAKELNLPAIVSCDAHYLKLTDQEAHEVLLCVQTGAYLTDKDRMSLKDLHLNVADPKDIIKRWGKTHPELITNTKKIASRCNVEIELDKIMIPKYPVPAHETEKSLLHKKVWQGLAWRYGGKNHKDAHQLSEAAAKKILPKEVVTRAEYELGVTDKMNYNGYFLIVADFINWGKDLGIVFGPGRGSAAGSIIAYATRITELDPLEHDLLFERFLNPDRISMPDIDIDIQDNRRDEVINYCIDEYGRDRVANIVTFGRMAARNSVRDVARVLQVPYADADRMAKMIPPPVQGRHTSLAKHLEQVAELRDEYRSGAQAKRVFDLAIKLEGTIRSHGVHAAGVVIAPDDIVKFVPLEMAQKGVIATQYSMGPIEDLGLLKMDFLGLSNLTIIKNTLRIVKKVFGKNIDITQISMSDKQTFDLLQRGETTGVFQLESAGMKRYLKELKPTTFDDIIAMVALYRPGPLTAGLTDKFIARKNGQEKVSYDHETMEPALKNTYGVMVYQEQFMQIVKDMCGFSGGQADTLRKAVGKKKRDLMAQMKELVIKGSIKNGVDKKVAEKFWHDLEGFADYAFNKSHAACYGLIAYQTAYLKAHYPSAFMAALMTSDYDNTDRLAIEIAECKHMGLEVQPPDVDESFHEFAVVPDTNQIRFGLDAIKNVGHGAVEEILRAREKSGGKFKSLEDFCQSVSPQIVNRKPLESLTKAGAFDRFGSRSELVNNLDNILAYSNRLQKATSAGQVDLFGDGTVSGASVKLTLDKNDTQYPESEQLAWERELLGIYLSHHPLQAYSGILSGQTVPISELKAEMEGAGVTVGGSITVIREITTRTGSKMAFVKIADVAGEIEVVVFPKAYAKKTVEWLRDQVVIIKGKVDGDRRGGSDELKILADEVHLVSEEEAKNYENKGVDNQVGPVVTYKPKVAEASATASTAASAKPRLYIRLENSNNQKLLITLKEKLDLYKGDTEVVLVTGLDSSKQIIKLPQSIDVNETSLRDIAGLFGATNVVVR